MRNSMNNKFKSKFFTIFLSLFLLLGLNTPSFAGSGTDGNIQVTWVDKKKNYFKGCNKLKLKIELVRQFEIVDDRSASKLSYITGELTLYNSEDDELGSMNYIIKSSAKPTNLKLQLCDALRPIGKGPYYLEVIWDYQTYGNMGPGDRNSFEIPFKFKK